MWRDDEEDTQASAKESYQVGYRKPPKHSRFKPGQSGNPQGRAKGVPNVRTHLTRILDQKVVVSEQGGRRTITKREAILTQLVNNAAGKGDYRAAKLVLELEYKLERGDHNATCSIALSVPPFIPDAETSTIEFDSMTTEELKKIFDAVEILDNYGQGPKGVPLPPTGPTKKKS